MATVSNKNKTNSKVQIKDMKCELVGYNPISDVFFIKIGESPREVKPSMLRFEDSEIEYLKKEGAWDKLLGRYNFIESENRLSKPRRTA